ncbi:diaminopimelate decarboxylase [Fodinicola acaciae]|uniref:diaminopimelate decarboxylase n=1 Tax=Fodinicola acaciae TaxID=2681555 RepID=UPI0013D2A80F|nr:diaminopimelate decarboxylase [Fodinicola acaciae]
MRAHPAGPAHGDLINPAAPNLPPEDLNGLHPSVWPATAERSDGVLSIGGLDVRDLVRDFGSPLYLLDEADLRARARALREAFAGAEVYYAGKAFLSVGFARWVASEGFGLDVCSGGELAIALRAGFPVDRIAMHGNNKSERELTRAVEAGVGTIVLDSYAEIVRLADIAAKADIRQRVMVRTTVGVEAHTHEFIATAHEDQKFGFSFSSGAAAEAVRRVLKLPSLELVGLHSHIGSQIFDTAGFEVAAKRVVQLLADIREEHDVELAELDLGGGLGVAYTAEDDPAQLHRFAADLRTIVAYECGRHGLKMPKIVVEPGRALVGPAGITLYEVGTVKPVQLDAGAVRHFVSVDGGMSDNIRTALYDAAYTCALASRGSDAEPMLARVVGKHCESGDIVVKDAWLPADVQPGDLLAIAGTGAYCRSMASNYNQVPRPPVVSVGSGQAKVLLRRETEDDLLRLDAG